MLDIARAEGRGCERCGIFCDISRGPRGTAYHYDGKIGDREDPNYANLCDVCWVEERSYWRGMWQEYYGSRL